MGGDSETLRHRDLTGSSLRLETVPILTQAKAEYAKLQ
jgi:hypothetical protein